MLIKTGRWVRLQYGYGALFDISIVTRHKGQTKDLVPISNWLRSRCQLDERLGPKIVEVDTNGRARYIIGRVSIFPKDYRLQL